MSGIWPVKAAAFVVVHMVLQVIIIVTLACLPSKTIWKLVILIKKRFRRDTRADNYTVEVYRSVKACRDRGVSLKEKTVDFGKYRLVLLLLKRVRLHDTPPSR